MAFVRYDADDPMVAGFIARVVALRPAEWDRLSVCCACGGPHDESRDGWFIRAIGDFTYRSIRKSYAPAWAWRGVGPFRLLGEVLERSYVSSLARQHVLMALNAIVWRDSHPPDLARRAYARLEPLIPWESLPGAPPAPWAAATR